MSHSGIMIKDKLALWIVKSDGVVAAEAPTQFMVYGRQEVGE